MDLLFDALKPGRDSRADTLLIFTTVPQSATGSGGGAVHAANTAAARSGSAAGGPPSSQLAASSHPDEGEDADGVTALARNSKRRRTKAAAAAASERPAGGTAALVAAAAVAAAPAATAASAATAAASGQAATSSRAVLIQQLVSGGRGLCFNAYSDVLKGAAHYFETRLDARWQDGTVASADGRTSDSGQMVVIVPVDEPELAACGEFLRLLYIKQLGPAAAGDPQLLLQVARLADRLHAQPAMDTCSAALAALPPDQLSEGVVCEVLQLPAGLTEGDGFKQLHATSVQRLLQLYGDAAALLANEEHRQRFCELPFSAVRTWAGSDELQADSEDTVLVLLNLWVHGPQGQQGSEGERAQQHAQLSTCVRVVHLSSWFLSVLQLGDFAWFHQQPGRARLLVSVVPIQRVIAAKPTTWDARGNIIRGVRASGGLPSSWLLDERPGTRESTSCVARVSRAELSAAMSSLRGAMKVFCNQGNQPNTLVHHGIMLEPSVGLIRKAPGAFYLIPFMQCCAEQALLPGVSLSSRKLLFLNLAGSFISLNNNCLVTQQVGVHIVHGMMLPRKGVLAEPLKQPPSAAAEDGFITMGLAVSMVG